MFCIVWTLDHFASGINPSLLGLTLCKIQHVEKSRCAIRMAYSIDVGDRTELKAIQNSPLLVSRSQHAQIQLHTAFEKN
jgi:hypothetical protein